jgi:hypothetical protein
MSNKQKQKRKQKRPRTKPAAPSLEILRNAEMVSVEHFPLIEPAFTPASLRWHLFHRERNGLSASGAVVQIGRRLLLRPNLFRVWAQSYNSQQRAA